MKKELERVEFKIDDENALRAVSIVKDPAIEKSFQLFKAANIHDNCKCQIVDGELITEATACDYCKEKARMNNFKSVEEKMEITGVAMTPNKDILRKDESGKYYYCWFSEDTIKKAAHIFLKNGNNTMANFDHNQSSFTDKISISESWIVNDPNNDKLNSLGFTDISKGDWAITYKVEDKELWNEIKKNGFTGFSIEGIFGEYERLMKEDKDLSRIKSILLSSLTDMDKERLIKAIIYTK